MKTSSGSQKKEQAGAEENRAVGKAAEGLPKKQKKILNLKEEGQHKTGKDRLASEEAIWEAGNDSGK